MEKVSLYDPERDVVVDVILSREDILRAQNDLTFATSLLNAAIKDKNITKDTESIFMESISTQQIMRTIQEPIHETNAGIDISNDDTVDNSMYRWSTAAVLLDTYKICQDKFSSGKYSHKKIWDEISAILVEKGHITTGPQCAAKLRSMKKTYKSVKDHNNLSGNDRRTWQFYEIMDDIFSKRAWCSPVAVASSTGLSVKQVKDSELFVTESTSELSSAESTRGIKRKEPSASKENMNLFQKKLDQKNEHEKAKAERHKERLKMDEKFLAVLTKLAEK